MKNMEEYILVNMGPRRWDEERAATWADYSRRQNQL